MDLEQITAGIRERFDRFERAREKTLTLHRELIRTSGLAIRAVHRHDHEEANSLLVRAGDILRQVREAVADQPAVYYAGYVHDAHKEYAEACLTHAIVSDSSLPSPQDLGVEDAAWLNGLGEAVGELRRYILDSLRRRDTSHAEMLLTRMDEIYYVLTSMDYPDTVTRGLRRTTDVARGCLEKTRGDLTQHVTMRDLEERLDGLRAAR